MATDYGDVAVAEAFQRSAARVFGVIIFFLYARTGNGAGYVGIMDQSVGLMAQSLGL